MGFWQRRKGNLVDKSSSSPQMFWSNWKCICKKIDL
jgi:hypothetical protein